MSFHGARFLKTGPSALSCKDGDEQNSLVKEPTRDRREPFFCSLYCMTEMFFVADVCLHLDLLRETNAFKYLCMFRCLCRRTVQQFGEYIYSVSCRKSADVMSVWQM